MNEKKAQPKFPLGQLLLEKGLITESQLNQALAKQRETGDRLGTTLFKLGFIDEETIFMPVLAGQMNVEHVNLNEIDISQEAVNMIPPKFATHYKILPFDFKDGVLFVAMAEPNDITTIDEIGMIVDTKIKPVLASEKEILEAIRKYYGVGAETIDKMMDNVKTTKNTSLEIEHIDDMHSQASISQFLNQILLEAYNDRATDIHIEPFEDELQIRYRIDGMLNDAKVPKNIIHFKDAINSRIKILSKLNIAEKRMPQDGRFKVRVSGIDLDLRVSFLPTPYGESVVMRLLNSTSLYDFDQLGLDEREQEILYDLIKRPHGIVFLTGPTGSGKTTTLYSCLSRINTEDKKVITIEDPVEYQLKGVTQIQVNTAVGLTFAQGLRSTLRHDPDVMMVGEVRDIETAEIAIQSALTGHLMFSTLHTNDAAGGVARLLDMGVEPYLITSTVECFIAQRLVRMLCPKCKQERKITTDILKDFQAEASGSDSELTVFEPKGCEACKMTGYTGREAIYEFLLVTEPIKRLIMESTSAEDLRQKAAEEGMKTLRQNGWEKVKQGKTSLEEIVRVTQEEE